jgi:hypothetical protein
MINPKKTAIFLAMEIQYYLHPVPGSVIILPKTQPFCPFSMENFLCSTLPGRLIRFIFMGNQPFFGNGEAMELPAGDAGSRLLMSRPIFWEFGNGEARNSWFTSCCMHH